MMENLMLFEKYSIRPTKRGQRPKLTLEVRWPKLISDQFQGPSPVPRGPSMAKDSEKMFQIEARNSEIGEIMKEGWSSHLWSDFDGNCIFVDGLGAIWKIFIQTNQKRPEAKVDLGGQMTTLSKWCQINSRGHPQYLETHPWPKILKNVSNRGQRPETVKLEK